MILDFFLWLTLLFLAETTLAIARSPTKFVHASSSSVCCNVLRGYLNTSVSFPGDTVYVTEQQGLPNAGYWSQQPAGLQPKCRFTPTCTAEVSEAVRLLEEYQCSFAIRGGGHTSWAEAANIGDNGLTIDLSALNDVAVAEPSAVAASGISNIVSVGGGARWLDVYKVLDSAGLGTAGGRVADVGVGGLTLGGGKSFFQAQTGFACDNVVNFELVTGCGRILQVNENRHPNLFTSLKGGSNNFGIVTRFDLKTFPLGQFWGGQFVYPGSTLPAQLQAFYNFVESSDVVASGNPESILAYVRGYFGRTSPSSIVANFLTFTLPQAYPPIFDEFVSIQPLLTNSSRISNLTDFAIELETGTPNGLRYLFGTATFANNRDFLRFVTNASDSSFNPLFAASVANLQVSTVFQPLTRSMLAPGCGKNALGLCPGDGNLVILDLTIQWNDASDDTSVNDAARSFINKVTSEASNRNVSNEYVYLNYALQSQDPLASYGNQSLESMRQASRQYDPRQVFQKQVPGGFKLWRN